MWVRFPPALPLCLEIKLARKKKVIEVEDNTILGEILVKQLNDKLGDVAYITGKQDTPNAVKHWLSTGSTWLDTLISNNLTADGGIPVGRMVEIYGASSTGKSMLAYKILQDCKKKGGIPVLIDTENSANFEFLQLLGLDPYDDEFIYVQVNSIEKVFQVMEQVIRSVKENDPDRMICIVWDSVAGTSTDQEIRNDYGENTIGLAARLIGQGLRKITRTVGVENVSLVFLNQIRKNIGVMFGDDTVTPGGQAISFFTSVRIRLYSGGLIKNKDGFAIGARVRAMLVKNRMSPHQKESAEFELYFNTGLVDESDWIDILLKYGKAKKVTAQSSTIEFDGEEVKVANRNFVDLMRKNPELREYCKSLVKESLIIERADVGDKDSLEEPTSEDDM